MTGTIEWNDPAVILPPERLTVLVAHTMTGEGSVEPGMWFAGAFRDPDGFNLENVCKWAMMPEFPDL